MEANLGKKILLDQEITRREIWIREGSSVWEKLRETAPSLECLILGQEDTTCLTISSVSALRNAEKGIKFGKSGRDEGDGELGVGPGAYETNKSSFHITRGTFPRGARDKFKPGLEIGPGSYDASKNGFGGKGGYTIQGKARAGEGDEVPGPAAYDYGKFLDKQDWSKGFKLPRAEKKGQNPSNDIGPGGYDLKDPKGGGFSFGKDKKDHEGMQFVPGPGQYPLKDVPPLNSGVKFGRQKRGMNYKSTVTDAGPGAYNLKDPNGGGFSFGKDPKDHISESAVPGPGQYPAKKVNPLSNLGKFGRQRRGIDINKDKTGAAGGPGDYNPKVDNWSGGYSIGREKRHGLADEAGNPGVGAYEIRDPKRGGYSFKRSNKDQKPATTPGFYPPMYSVPDVPKYLLPPEPQRKIHL